MVISCCHHASARKLADSLVSCTASSISVHQKLYSICTRLSSNLNTSKLDRAETPKLSERRKRAKLCHLYKILHGLTDCQTAPVQVKSPAYDTRQVSNFTLENIRANSSQFLFLYSFFPHSISLWNSQPLKYSNYYVITHI